MGAEFGFVCVQCLRQGVLDKLRIGAVFGFVCVQCLQQGVLDKLKTELDT